MTTKVNLPLDIWLEIQQSIERIELAKKLSLTGSLVHAAAHIRLHEQGEYVLGNLRFQRQEKRRSFLQIDSNCAELFKIGANFRMTKVPIVADYDLPDNIVNFKTIEIRLGMIII